VTRRLAAAIASVLAVAFLAAPTSGAQAPVAPVAPPLLTPTPITGALARTIDPVIDALWSRFSRRSAMGHVVYISQFWRLSGNVGYDATINRIHERLLAVGFEDGTAGRARASGRVGGAAGAKPSRSEVWVEEYPNAGKGWRYTAGTLALEHAGAPDEVLLSRETTNLDVCINSFPTPAGGVVAPVVDVGAGDTDAAYASAKDAIVLGDADPAQLWRRAMAHGARGVISTSLGAYVSPDRPGAAATPRDQWNILQWGSIPYDEAHQAFAFKATPHAAFVLRQALAHDGTIKVRATVESTFSTKPNRMLIAEIPGRVAPNERVVITAHVQEPGANDNASGVATLAEMARALRAGIRAGTIPQPDRTITFLWLEEISGSREWLKDHAGQAKGVRDMFSMDMTGEDTRKTGGTFLIERWPDPGAVWDRPWDPHTAWGRGDVTADAVKGDLLNDLHFAICGRVAARTGWVVRTNPYEGGSDHTVFGSAGIPAVLDWHFTDRYYHTNDDTADKTSPSEMRNVGVSVAASAWLLASTREATATSIAALVARAGAARLAIEEREGAKLAAADGDRVAATSRQDQIVQAWKKWYGEAVRSAARIVTGPPSAALSRRLDELAAPVTGK
jgi:Zn-dependent M28 family amino/carboxypeptidase